MSEDRAPGWIARRIQAENEQLREDLALTGNAYALDGRQVPPEDVIAYTVGDQVYRPEDVVIVRSYPDGRVCTCGTTGPAHTTRCGLNAGHPLFDPAEQMNAAADAVVDQAVDNLKNQQCKGVETTIRSQDEFLTVLDEMLDDTLHDDHCYIHPSDTECVCILGRIRAILPPCGAVEDKGNGVYWKCIRNAHPAGPDRHIYG